MVVLSLRSNWSDNIFGARRLCGDIRFQWRYWYWDRSSTETLWQFQLPVALGPTCQLGQLRPNLDQIGSWATYLLSLTRWALWALLALLEFNICHPSRWVQIPTETP